MRIRCRFAALIWLMVAGVAVSGSAMAQDAADQRSKLQVHGFLTQAYAKANFLSGGLATPTASEIELGIPEDGTTAYRNLALQFRYEISPQDIVVVQFSNRSLGDSYITELEDEVELDWGFYERRIGSDTSIKIGRVQIPLGIFNEIRDVGTTLPFYRPSFAFYQEGSFTSETLDGIVASHPFAAESDWSLEADVYVGEWDLVESVFDGTVGSGTIANFALARTKDSFGFQLWQNTPVSGLRFGFGGHRRKVKGGVFRPEGVTGGALNEFYVSADGTFEKWAVRAEYREFEPEIATPFFLIHAKLSSYYAQVGYFVTPEFHVWLQYENQKDDSTSVSFTNDFSRDLRTDIGLALNYFITPNLVIKAEYHETEEEQLTFNPVFVPPVPVPVAFQPVIVPSDGGSYWILSFSASF